MTSNLDLSHIMIIAISSILFILNIFVIFQTLSKIKFLKRVHFSLSRVVTTQRWSDNKKMEINEANLYSYRNEELLKLFDVVNSTITIKKTCEYLKKQNEQAINQINHKIGKKIIKDQEEALKHPPELADFLITKRNSRTFLRNK